MRLNYCLDFLLKVLPLRKKAKEILGLSYIGPCLRCRFKSDTSYTGLPALLGSSKIKSVTISLDLLLCYASTSP